MIKETHPPQLSILLIDNYDSFTYNLADYFWQTGIDCQVLRNDEVSVQAFAQMDVQGLVFSPGPGRPSEAGVMMELLEYAHDRMPILGICLGHQAIGEWAGADLVHAQKALHGKTSIIQHNGHFLFKGVPVQHEVMRYHSLILESIPDILEVTAETLEGEVMAMAHRFFPMVGVQFHPESILTPFGKRMIFNWVAYVRHFNHSKGEKGGAIK